MAAERGVAAAAASVAHGYATCQVCCIGYSSCQALERHVEHSLVPYFVWLVIMSRQTPHDASQLHSQCVMAGPHLPPPCMQGLADGILEEAQPAEAAR